MKTVTIQIASEKEAIELLNYFRQRVWNASGMEKVAAIANRNEMAAVVGSYCEPPSKPERLFVEKPIKRDEEDPDMIWA